MFDKVIRYDCSTRDYRMELDGTLIGFARTYHEAEVTLDQTAYELLVAGHFSTATELDGGAVCPTCGDDGDCPDCDTHTPMLMPEGDWIDVEGMRVVAPTSGMVVVQIATETPESLREDCLNVITMALGQTHGAASVVTELRRLKARLETAGMSRIVALD